MPDDKLRTGPGGLEPADAPNGVAAAGDDEVTAQSDTSGALATGEPVVAAARAIDPLMRCLLRVTQFNGRPISEAEIRNICPIPDRGVDITTFRRAAERVGYQTRMIAPDRDNIGRLPLPFVLLGDGDEPPRVAMDREGPDLVLYDPILNAAKIMPTGEVLSTSTGAVLIKPVETRTAAGRTKMVHDWRHMVGQRVKRVIWELLLASLVINIFALASPLFVMTVYNKVIGQNALSTLNVMAIGMVGVYAFDFLLRSVRGYISSHTGARVDALIGSELVHHLLHLPYRYFESTSTGVISERLRQLDTIRHFFAGQMPMTLVDLTFVGVFLGALYWIQPLLAAIVTSAIPVFVILSAVLHRRQKKLIEQSFAAQAAKTSAMAETISNALTIKSLGLEGDVEKRWGDRLALSAWAGFKAGNVNNIVSVVGIILQHSVGLVIIYFGALAVIDGDISIGALIAANILGNRAMAPMRQVVSAWYQMQEVRAAFRRIDDIMGEAVESQPGELAALPPLNGDVEFDDVTFRYGEDLPPVLQGVSLKIEAGTVLGVIGPSGSGKSTLAKLIQGLYAPDNGRVLIDDTDIRHISPAALRRQIGSVPQDIQLFSGSVRDNIVMGTGQNDPDRVVAVAKFVGAHQFIQCLPKGYDTVLGERGGGLSAGQRQLICIARALIRNPRILVFDEATSALDVVSEQALMTSLRHVAKGRTIILVSHRLAPVAVADQVAFLIDGQVEKLGPPADVIAYAKTRMADHAAAGAT